MSLLPTTNRDSFKSSISNLKYHMTGRINDNDLKLEICCRSSTQISKTQKLPFCQSIHLALRQNIPTTARSNMSTSNEKHTYTILPVTNIIRLGRRSFVAVQLYTRWIWDIVRIIRLRAHGYRHSQKLEKFM